ncbi:MurR/RpiR family transcriptional regulator [Bordetella sp. BOR01]|uniref:MurR/RpiR family transcriptional regulator n=1 Tax=Bordetella sp. BOR01 TaxID=2854779 RepID=UPI001C4483C0|nr:MurR/RpiR family transcriptional regulator [Bordetella sp. BOR01]MBV7482985.1 MurR/RpiR family transcriptional regulator [Bordetella sp. BOR01]
MLSSQLSERIRKNIENMSEGARVVAEFVLARPEDVAMLPAARVAEKLDVSESTVMRFAVLLGYKGYAAFRRDLQSDIRRQLAPLQRLALDKQESKDSQRPYARMFHQDIENILRTERNLTTGDIDRAVDLICNAQRIFVVGVRSSYGLAHTLCFQLQQMLGNVVLLNTVGGDALDDLRGIGLQDLLITISFPRHAALTVAATRYARERNARIIAITDSALSPTAVDADILFPVNTSVLSIATSLTGAMSLVNAISSEILVTNRSRVAKNLADVEEILSHSKVHYSD